MTAEFIFSLGLVLLPNLIHPCKAPDALLLVLFQQSRFTQHANESFEHQICFFPKFIALLCDKGDRIFQIQAIGTWSSLVLNAFGLS